jgi:carboxyl-terminal processing protease
LIAGETSFGKGLVQRQFPLFDNSAIRLTISKYFTPTGRSIQRDYENKETYYSELGERVETESDNITHTAERDSLRPVFKTEGGRTVYGGGGISPDYIIPSEKLTEYTRDLLRNNVFYQFILKYVENHGEEISLRFEGDLLKFRNDFNFTAEEQKQFIDFAEEKGVAFIQEDYTESKDYIFARLKAQLARNYWKNEGWYTILLDVDTQFLKSVTLFDEAKDLANLK